MLGVLVARPEVVSGRDDDERHEGGEEVEEGVAAVVVLELLPRHGSALPAPPPAARSAQLSSPRRRPAAAATPRSAFPAEGGERGDGSLPSQNLHVARIQIDEGPDTIGRFPTVLTWLVAAVGIEASPL